MNLRLYDTLHRAVREFEPLEPDRVTMYLCGATVQSPPHVGHIRSGLAFDILRRWLLAQGLEVVFVRNVTDIDDKILANAVHEDVPYWVVAMRNERAFTWAYDVLGCLPPTYEPRATGHVPEMVALMHRLVDSDHAYASAGDVYFDVRSYEGYGALSRQHVDDMLPAADSEVDVKRDPRDFALWKGAKPGEPAWVTPWGPGRPGWHLECSAMATKYLGPVFDIHGGGLDLVFPHHENELAQSRAAGDGFARYWMHNAWVTTAGEKMSKSLGNSLLVSEVVKHVRPVELRYYLGSAHYRSSVEFSYESLEEAAAGYRRVESFLDRAESALGTRAPMVPDVFAGAGGWPEEFAVAMDDDVAVPQALAVLHDTVRGGNAALDRGDLEEVGAAYLEVLAMTAVLGVSPKEEPWVSFGSGGDAALRAAVDALVAAALEERAAARQRRDFAAADAVRDRLADAGIRVEDTPSGPRWSLAGGS